MVVCWSRCAISRRTRRSVTPPFSAHPLSRNLRIRAFTRVCVYTHVEGRPFNTGTDVYFAVAPLVALLSREKWRISLYIEILSVRQKKRIKDKVCTFILFHFFCHYALSLLANDKIDKKYKYNRISLIEKLCCKIIILFHFILVYSLLIFVNVLNQ